MEELTRATDKKKVEEEFSLKNLFVPLTSLKAIHWIIFIGLVVYFNSLFNGFVFDDIGQIVNNTNIQSLSTIPSLFIHPVTIQEISNYYRPLPLTFYAIIYFFFQANTFPYHFIQVIFHIGNTILVFLILKNFLKRNLSFFMSLFFLVHPINEETVVYIANLQDTLFLFFGLLAFYLLRQKYSLKKYLILGFSLFLSLLSKETGILFILISFIYLFLFEKEKLQKSLPFLFTPLIFYSILRIISPIPFHKQPLIPIMALSFWQRLINIPAIIFYYLKTLFFPKVLVALHSWAITQITVENFYLSLLVDILFLGAIAFVGLKIIKNQKKLFFFFLVWFLLGLAIHLQLVPLDYTVADHYFYFPFIGLLGIIGLSVQEIKLSKQGKYICAILVVTVLILLTGRTMIRNADWINQSVLLAHDEKIEQNDYLLELLYTTDLIQNNQLNKALPHIHKAIILYPNAWVAWSSLGTIYMQQQKYSQAKQAYLHSLSLGDYFGTYENMALLLLNHDDINKAKEFIIRSSNKYPNSEKLWYYRIVLDYRLKNYDDELFAAKNYYLLKQDKESYTILYYIQNHLPINIQN